MRLHYKGRSPIVTKLALHPKMFFADVMDEAQRPTLCICTGGERNPSRIAKLANTSG